MRRMLLLFWLATLIESNAATNLLQTAAAASQGLTTFRKFITADNFEGLGFDTTNEVSSAALGRAMWVYTVRLKDLALFRPGKNPNLLLKDYEQALYPVVASGKVRSSLLVKKMEANWDATTFGYPESIVALAAARATLMSTTLLPLADFFVVEIPALQLSFIGYRKEGVLMLMPAVAHPDYGLNPNKADPAAQIFLSLVPIAKKQTVWPN